MFKKLAVAVIIFAIALIFLGSFLIALSDGQGAFVFVFSVPLWIMLFSAGFFLVRALPNDNLRVKRLLKATLALEIAVIVLSFFFPGPVTTGLAKAFENVTGFTPYVWTRLNRPLATRLNVQLAQAKNEITLAQISPGKPWNKLCIFGPYTTEEDAAKVLGFRSATMARSGARTSDAVVALVYFDGSGTVEIVDVRRDALDLADLSRTCLSPEGFPLKIDESGGRRRIKN